MIAVRSLLLITFVSLAAPADAQSRLTLDDAIARARAQNRDVSVARSVEREAAQQLVQARAGYLPRVDFTEAWQRGDHPVFVFSSLLAQRRFAADNFAIDALNHPDAIDNFRAAVTLEQALFDPAVGAGVRAAAVNVESAAARQTLTSQDLVVAATSAYGAVLVAVRSQQAAAAALDAARADRELAANRRDAGLATDADVLQLDVHLAVMRGQQIRADADERIARARLNEVMDEPLDAVFALEPPAESAVVPPLEPLASLEGEGLKNRADVKLAMLQQELADAAHDTVRAAFLPQVAVQAGWEANGGNWQSRSSSWVVGVVGRMNLFRGFADRARLAEAAERQTRRATERDRTETAARLDIRAAVARVEAARASEEAGRAAAAQARESRRIVRDRYESGLADVASLLRAAESVQQAELREIAAQVEVITAAAALKRALGKQ